MGTAIAELSELSEREDGAEVAMAGTEATEATPAVEGSRDAMAADEGAQTAATPVKVLPSLSEVAGTTPAAAVPPDDGGERAEVRSDLVAVRIDTATASIRPLSERNAYALSSTGVGEGVALHEQLIAAA